MRLHEKCNRKRYCIFAKRVGGKSWTEWAQTDNKVFSMEQVNKIRELGFLAKLFDRKKKKVLISD